MMIPGGRKFWLAHLALIFAFILALIEKLTADYVIVASIAVGAFSAANWAVNKVHGP